MRQLLYLYILVSIVALLSCGSPQPTPEELAKIQALKGELEQIQKEITEASARDAELAGGLLKVLVEARLEILKTNEALVQQRIHALESGAKITVGTMGSEPNPELASKLEEEIKAQEKELLAAQQEAAKYSGGLILAMKLSTIATQENSLAMLRQRYLIAKYGLSVPSISAKDETTQSITRKTSETPTGAVTKEKIANEVISVHLSKKRFEDRDYEDRIAFDVEFKAIGLDKPARAIKGVFNLHDLFGEIKLRLGCTLNKPIEPGGKIHYTGWGFDYNRFVDSHAWVLSTDLKDMKASFTVNSIIYQDGTQRDLM